MADIQPDYHFVDPGLNYLFTKTYDLSIRIMPDGFSFVVFDTQKSKFIALVEFLYPDTDNRSDYYGSDQYIQWLDEITRQQILLKESYNKVFVLTGSRKHTLVPLPLFEPENSRKYLEFNHLIDADEIVLYDVVKAPESGFIYAIPLSLKKWIGKHYSGHKLFHHCGALIRAFFLQYRGTDPATRMLLNVRNGIFDLIVIRDSSFKLCNSYHFSNNIDLLYYVLFVAEQLKIDLNASLLFLGGTQDVSNQLTGILKNYVRHVEMIPETRDNKFSPSLDNASLHRYYDLLNVSLCG